MFRRLSSALLALALLLGRAAPAGGQQARGVAAPPSRTADATLAVALRELEAGRPYHASRLLTAALRAPGGRTEERLLVAGRAAAAWGGWSEVERLLADVSFADPAATAEARHLLARSAFERGRARDAVVRGRLALAAATTPAQRGALHVLLARAWERLREPDSANAEWRRSIPARPLAADWLRLHAAATERDAARRDSLLAAITTPTARARSGVVRAEAHERFEAYASAERAWLLAGDSAAAARVRLRVDSGAPVRDSVKRALLATVRARPSSADARRAAALLDSARLELDPDESLLVARSSRLTGRTARAIALFERAVRDGAATDADRHALGLLLVRVGRPADAARVLATLPPDSRFAGSAAYHRGRALLRARDLPGAVRALREVVARFPDDTAAAGAASFLLGDLAMDDGREAEARAHFRRVVERHPGSASAVLSGLRAALIAYAAGDARTAARELDLLLARAARGEERLAVPYWAGRMWAAAGVDSLARARWSAVLRDDPASWYGMLTARRLGRPVWAPPPVTALGAPAPAPAALRRAVELASLGLAEDAARELDAAQAGVQGAGRTALARALLEDGYASRAIAVAGAARLAGAAEDASLYALLYPAPQDSVLEAEARRHEVDPALAAALVRQESRFTSRATSPVGARGLMQVMPSVGRRLAAARGWMPWDDALLWQPDVSLALGMGHLAQMLRTYPEEAHALAAYNAGGSRVKRWLRATGVAADPELFVERIPYAETRDYVRIILRSREFYRVLHAW